MLRTAAPGLDGILKANRGKASTESKGQFREVPEIAKPSPAADVPARQPRKTGGKSHSPYREGSTYDILFMEGSRKFQARDELVKRVAAITGKSTECIGFSLSVLCHKAHSSNNGRSMALIENGKVKLIAIRRKPNVL
jgi:hypothetical protein